MAERGVMLAERPSFASAPNPSFGGGGFDSSVGNFKGVMLCNRPGVTEGSKSLGSGGPGFKPLAASHETIHPGGRDVDFMERMEKAKSRDRPQTLAEKIREDLAEIVEKKRQLMRAKAEEEIRRLERRARFQESQAKVRDAIRSQAILVDLPADENALPSDSGAYAHLDKPVQHKSKGGKPAWLTSSSAAAVAEEEEEEDLLDFVKGFNPDKYEEDLEDKAGGALLSQQIADVEAEETAGRVRLARYEQDELAALEVRADRAGREDERKMRRRRRRREAREVARRAGGVEVEGDGAGGAGDDGLSDAAAYSSGEEAEDGRSVTSSVGPMTGRQRYGGNDERGAHVRIRSDDDAASIATSVLSSASAMRAVHSHASMSRVVERTQKEEKDRISAALAIGDVNAASSVAFPVLDAPRVAEHNDLRQSIEKVKNLVSNLPYQHRNPVI